MIVKLGQKNELQNLGFRTYYNHCEIRGAVGTGATGASAPARIKQRVRRTRPDDGIAEMKAPHFMVDLLQVSMTSKRRCILYFFF